MPEGDLRLGYKYRYKETEVWQKNVRIYPLLILIDSSSSLKETQFMLPNNPSSTGLREGRMERGRDKGQG